MKLNNIWCIHNHYYNDYSYYCNSMYELSIINKYSEIVYVI